MEQHFPRVGGEKSLHDLRSLVGDYVIVGWVNQRPVDLHREGHIRCMTEFTKFLEQVEGEGFGQLGGTAGARGRAKGKAKPPSARAKRLREAELEEMTPAKRREVEAEESGGGG